MVHIHGTSGLNGPVVGPEARESRGCAAFVGAISFSEQVLAWVGVDASKLAKLALGH